jgi:hypothetical protein
MRDWLRTLWLMLDTQNCGYTSHRFDGWIEADVLNVLKQSWLRETSASDYVVCPECLDHDEQPVMLESPGRDARWFIPCPEYGRVRLRPEELRQWCFDMNAIATDIAEALSLTGTASVEVSQKLWRLGRAPWQQKSREVWLLRDWKSLSEAELKSAMKPAARAIVLTYDSVVPEPLWLGRSPAFVALSQVSQWCDNWLSFDARHLFEVVTEQDEIVGEAPPQQRLRVPARAIRRQVKEEIASMLTDEALVAAYMQHGSVRLAAESLSKQTKTEISKDKVHRALKRSGVEINSPANHNSCSVRRTVASQRCDNRKIISNSTDAVDWQ